MKWQTASLILTSILIASGVVTYTDLFVVLFQLTGVNATHSGDMYCKEICPTYINITTSYWNIGFESTKPNQGIYIDVGDGKLTKTTMKEYPNTVLYKKWRYGRKLWVNLNNINSIISTNPVVQVEWLVPARGKDNWRPIKDGDSWERGKINKIKLIGHKKEWQTVKWEAEMGEYLTIEDPLWISGVEVGGKIVKEVCTPIYKDWIEYIPHYKNCTTTCTEKNVSCTPKNYKCINYTEKIPHTEQIDCKKTGRVNVSGDIFQGGDSFCKLIKNDVCCLHNKEGGEYGNWDRTDGSVTKCCKDLITGELSCDNSLKVKREEIIIW